MRLMWRLETPLPLGMGRLLVGYVMSSSTVAEITTLHCHRKHTESEQIKKKEVRFQPLVEDGVPGKELRRYMLLSG